MSIFGVSIFGEGLYTGCIGRIIMKVYSSGMNQDVWRLSKLNSISMFYIRRSWQNYKNFNYRISIPLLMKNLRMKSHRKRWKCRFSRRKFIFRRILCKFRPLDLISNQVFYFQCARKCGQTRTNSKSGNSKSKFLRLFSRLCKFW